MPAQDSRLSPLALLALLALPATFTPVQADDRVLLTGTDVAAWADARLQPRSQRPQPLMLRLDNASGTLTDEALVQSADDAGDPEEGGVPLSFLQALLASQLAASGRVELIAAGSQPLPATVAAETAHLQVRLLHYRPAFRRGSEGSWSQGIASQWFAWQEDDPQPVTVELAADWQRRPSEPVRRLTVRVDTDTCQTLAHAPGYLPGAVQADSQYRSFAGHYQRSSIGQATLAALHRLLAWLDETTTELPQALAISSVRGERLQWQDPRGWLRRGDELPLYHRDNTERRIGSVRIDTAGDGIASGHAITLAAGSIRPGDQIRLTRPVEAPLIVPAEAPPAAQCQPETKTTGEAAPGDTTEETPTPPAPSDDAQISALPPAG